LGGHRLLSLRAESGTAAEPGRADDRGRAAGLPIDIADVIDGRPAAGGIIRPEGDPAKRELWPEAIYLRAHHTGLAYTLETPSALPLAQRLAAQVAAVTSVCDRFRRAG